MTNITDLQNIIVDDKFWKNRDIVTVIGLPGSGITTVLMDLNKLNTKRKYIYINMYNSGEVSEYSALMHIGYILKRYLEKEGIIKSDDFYIVGGDYYRLKVSIMRMFRAIRLKNDVVIIIDNFEVLLELQSYLFETLREFFLYKMDGDIRHFKFLIGSDKFLDGDLLIGTLGKFYPLVYENQLFISGFSEDSVVEVLEEVTHDKHKVASQILHLSGGNPKIVDRLLDYYAMKLALDNTFTFDGDQSTLTDDKEIAYILYRIWNGLTSQQILLIQDIYLGKNITLNPVILSNRFLISTGVIQQNIEHKYEIGIGLLKKLLSDSHRSIPPKIINREGTIKNIRSDINKDLSMNEATTKGPVGDYPLDLLSAQEMKVFLNFSVNVGKLVDKEEIANIIWERKLKSKRDDWAIYQIIKRIRSKLGKGFSDRLVTMRGVGYRYVPIHS